VADQVNGQHEKRRCWQNDTNLLVVDTRTNGFKEISKVFKEMDEVKMANS
tara:strand:- start:43 stop:192 length:150 start_codon:yes stop_codon:yes gene_type:complete